MFSEADGYERFMGRWSRRLAQLFVQFAQVGQGDHVLDVGQALQSRLRERLAVMDGCTLRGRAWPVRGVVT
jgi:hypothetical protein